MSGLYNSYEYIPPAEPKVDLSDLEIDSQLRRKKIIFIALGVLALGALIALAWLLVAWANNRNNSVKVNTQTNNTISDYCSNITGTQTSVPSDKIRNNDGTCVDKVVTKTDLCPNIDGVQEILPTNKKVDTTGNCVDSVMTTPTTTDVCPNIAGSQATLPTGKKVDAATGNCIDSVTTTPGTNGTSSTGNKTIPTTGPEEEVELQTVTKVSGNLETTAVIQTKLTGSCTFNYYVNGSFVTAHSVDIRTNSFTCNDSVKLAELGSGKARVEVLYYENGGAILGPNNFNLDL